MAGWRPIDFRSGKAQGQAFVARPAAEREMVGGTTALALYQAVKHYAERRKLPIYKTLQTMDLGSSTWKRMRAAERISQATALKIVTFLGTSLPAVLTKHQQEKK